MTDERVVRVVPLRPLRVQPQPAAGHQAAGLGEQLAAMGVASATASARASPAYIFGVPRKRLRVN